MSVRESALSALLTILDAALAPAVQRNTAIPENLPSGGFVTLQDGVTQDTQAILSPLRFQVTHRAELVLVVAATNDAARAAALDALVLAASNAVIANRSLSGTVEWAQPEAPEIDHQAGQGTPIVAAALLPITLIFTAADSPAG